MGVESAILGLGAFNAVSSIGSGFAQSSAYSSAAAVNNFNATRATNLAAAEAEENDERLRRLIGAQRAAAGASGITFAGSVGEVFNDTFIQGKVDSLRIREAGDIESLNFRLQASANKLQARSASYRGLVGGASSLVNSGVNAYSVNQRYGDGKLFSGGLL